MNKQKSRKVIVLVAVCGLAFLSFGPIFAQDITEGPAYTSERDSKGIRSASVYLPSGWSINARGNMISLGIGSSISTISIKGLVTADEMYNYLSPNLQVWVAESAKNPKIDIQASFGSGTPDGQVFTTFFVRDEQAVKDFLDVLATEWREDLISEMLKRLPMFSDWSPSSLRGHLIRRKILSMSETEKPISPSDQIWKKFAD